MTRCATVFIITSIFLLYPIAVSPQIILPQTPCDAALLDPAVHLTNMVQENGTSAFMYGPDNQSFVTASGQQLTFHPTLLFAPNNPTAAIKILAFNASCTQVVFGLAFGGSSLQAGENLLTYDLQTDTVIFNTQPPTNSVPNGTPRYMWIEAVDAYPTATRASYSYLVDITSPQNPTPRPSQISLLTSFPLKSEVPLKASPSILPTAYTAKINAVFDHSLFNLQETEFRPYSPCDGKVVAYTGELGDNSKDESWVGPNSDCSFGYDQSGRKAFYLNGGYGESFLYYDGHPGIDFRARSNTEVYAAAKGKVHYPAVMLGTKNTANLHVLELRPTDHPDYRIFYLHLATYKDQVPRAYTGRDNLGGSCPTVLPLIEGTEVESGCLIGLAGNAGTGKGGKAHLHFEVQKKIPIGEIPEAYRAGLRCPDLDLSDYACIPVDLRMG